MILAFIDSSTRDQSRKKRPSQTAEHEDNHVHVKVTCSSSAVMIERRRSFVESTHARYPRGHSTGRSAVNVTEYNDRRYAYAFSKLRLVPDYPFQDYDQLLDDSHTKLMETEQNSSASQFIWNNVDHQGKRRTERASRSAVV